jgi:UDP-N-acetylmuramoylalanine--D-glutamate ligase
MKTDWKGKHVLILGGARQGQAAARWLSRHGARVTVNDRRTPEQMAEAVNALKEASVSWVLGSHPIDLLTGAEVLCISGGVPLDNPLVVEAQKRGIPLTNDTQIFLENASCLTVGITGSAGKTTTTTLVGAMAERDRQERRQTSSQTAAPAVHPQVYVGGNIGDPLLNHVDEMGAQDLAILEISSFQLEQMSSSPHVAAILNITPNHLDRHGTMQAYTQAKMRILQFQSGTDTAVLNRDDPGSWGARTAVQGRLISFGFSPLQEGQEGTYLADGILHLRQRQVDLPLLRREQVHLRGDHNVLNVLAAFAIANVCGLSLDRMLAAAEDFNGVGHRLELVRELNGVRWYNDSIATAPERTMAAIRSFQEPIVLLLGGRDKDLPWEELVSLVCQRVDHVVLFGEAATKIADVFASARADHRPQTLERCVGLEEAVQSAARLARSGDIVLFSPGGTSFDQFRDFEERGEAFRQWVAHLS